MAKKTDEKVESVQEDQPVTRAEFDNLKQEVTTLTSAVTDLKAWARVKFTNLKTNWLRFLAIHHGSEHNDGKL